MTNTDAGFLQIFCPIAFVILAGIPLSALFVQPGAQEATAPHYQILKALNLCLTSTVISITSVLNFSLAASTAVALGLPLSVACPSSTLLTRITKYSIYAFLGLGWLLVGSEEVRHAIWDWEVLGVWLAPFVCIVYTPLVMQAAIVCLLPP